MRAEVERLRAALAKITDLPDVDADMAVIIAKRALEGKQ